MHARNPLAYRELVDGCFLGPTARRHLRAVSIERKPEIRHGRDVLWIMVSNCGPWRQPLYLPPEAAIAWIAMVMLKRGSFGDFLKSDEPSSAERRGT